MLFSPRSNGVALASRRLHARHHHLLSDDEYAELQGTLVVNPEAGDLIIQTGGLRNVSTRSGPPGVSVAAEGTSAT